MNWSAAIMFPRKGLLCPGWGEKWVCRRMMQVRIAGQRDWVLHRYTWNQSEWYKIQVFHLCLFRPLPSVAPLSLSSPISRPAFSCLHWSFEQREGSILKGWCLKPSSNERMQDSPLWGHMLSSNARNDAHLNSLLRILPTTENSPPSQQGEAAAADGTKEGGGKGNRITVYLQVRGNADRRHPGWWQFYFKNVQITLLCMRGQKCGESYYLKLFIKRAKPSIIFLREFANYSDLLYTRFQRNAGNGGVAPMRLKAMFLWQTGNAPFTNMCAHTATKNK